MVALTRWIGIALLGVAVSGCRSERITLGRSRGGNEPIGIGGARGDSPSPPVVCETTSRTTTRWPAALAFAFDVSGSMGRLDCPFWNHDPKYKWTPVTLATRAFFEDETQTGVIASMTLFPSKEDACFREGYATPDVPFVELPSPLFGSVLADYEAEVGLADYEDPMLPWGGTWRGGTPTNAAVSRVIEELDEKLAEDPSLRPAVILVTDGMPAGCGDEVLLLADLIATVSEARARGIKTYVIGVREPVLEEGALAPWDQGDGRVWACKSDAGNWLWDYSDPDTPREVPDNLANLHTIAAAGGSERAFLIDTGNPGKTKEDLVLAIEEIRRETIPCELTIPPPPAGSEAFDKEKIDISLSETDATDRLPYDPSCGALGGWHYDDEEVPKKIVLCPDTCAEAEASLTLTLRVDFLCEPRKPFIQ